MIIKVIFNTFPTKEAEGAGLEELGSRVCSPAHGREPLPTLPASTRGETRVALVWLGKGALRGVSPMFAECLSCVWLLRATSSVQEGRGRLRPSLRPIREMSP